MGCSYLFTHVRDIFFYILLHSHCRLTEGDGPKYPTDEWEQSIPNIL